MEFIFEDESQRNDPEIMAFLKDVSDAVDQLDEESLDQLQRAAAARGRDVLGHIMYKLRAHRGLCPVDPGDTDAADMVQLLPRMISGRPLLG